MDFRDLVLRTRSVRRFVEADALGGEVLESLVDLARQTGSAANKQPLKYVLSASRAMNEAIFSCLAWAAYLKDWPGPGPGERPAGYVVMLGDTTIAAEIDCDHGVAAQTIMLGATALGLGGCMLGAIDRARLAQVLALPETLKIELVLALGRPAETIVLDPLVPPGAEGNIRYWRDATGVHHVPKRGMDEIVVARYA